MGAQFSVRNLNFIWKSSARLASDPYQLAAFPERVTRQDGVSVKGLSDKPGHSSMSPKMWVSAVGCEPIFMPRIGSLYSKNWRRVLGSLNAVLIGVHCWVLLRLRLTRTHCHHRN